MAYDYTAFTKVDSLDRLTVSESKIDFHIKTGDTAYVYSDLGAGNIDQFHYRFEATCITCPYNTNAVLWAVSDTVSSPGEGDCYPGPRRGLC